MKKIPFILICALLALGSAGCSDYGNDLATENEQEKEIISSSDDKRIDSILNCIIGSWGIENNGNGSARTYNLAFKPDGTLEVKDSGNRPMDDYPSSGSYNYSMQIDEHIINGTELSGGLYIDHVFYRFWIRTQYDDPNTLELLLFHSTKSSECCITLTRKK